MADFVIDGDKNPEAKAQVAKDAEEKAIGKVIIRMLPDGVVIEKIDVTGQMLMKSLPYYIKSVIRSAVKPDSTYDYKAKSQVMLRVAKAVQEEFENFKEGEPKTADNETVVAMLELLVRDAIRERFENFKKGVKA